MGSVLYEVNITLPSTLKSDFLSWLRKHIVDMVALPGFQDATLFEVQGNDSGDGKVTIVAQYRLESMEAMNVYFEQYAPKMRGDLPSVFREQAQFTRRVLTVV